MSDCPTPESTGSECPNQFCDDRLVDLPSRQRIRVLGVEPGGKCLVEFPKGAKGFVVADGDGFVVTELPCVAIPEALNYAIDPVTGDVIVDDCGQPIRVANPGFDNIIITDEHGCQNRLSGLTGIPADLHWDGTKYVLKPTEGLGTKALDDYPVFDGYCNTHDMVLRTQEVCDPTKGKIEVAVPGRRSQPINPYGSIVAFGGPVADIPAGWLLCNGDSYDLTQYANLYRTIGIAYGGSGNSFNVPDMRSKYGIGAAPDADPPILLGETAGGSIGGAVSDDAAQTSFLPRYQSIWNEGGLTMEYVAGMIDTSQIPKSTASVENGSVIVTNIPLNASHIVCAMWALVANEISGQNVRQLVNAQVAGISGWTPMVGVRVDLNAIGVNDFNVSENLGSRYDLELPEDHGGTATISIRMDLQRYPSTSGWVAQYGAELFQHGFRLKGAGEGSGGLATNYIIYAGATEDCSNV